MTTFILITSIFFSAFISGVIGLGGGMILMGVLLFLFPVPQAMIVHGAIQLLSNGLRAFLFRRFILWQHMSFYFLGSLLSITALFSLAWRFSSATIFIILGLMPLVAIWKPQHLPLDFSRRGHSFFCGFLVSLVQLLVGVAGPMLELFFVNSRLSKEEIMGSKALTQTFSHLVKIFYYGSIVNLYDQRALILISIIPVVIANVLGKYVNQRLSKHSYFGFYRGILSIIACLYIIKGIYSLIMS